MYTKKYRKHKRKTRRGGFFNALKPKLQKDNIKDWYLYWKQSNPYYQREIRYPGYYNKGLYPILLSDGNHAIYQSTDIGDVPDCADGLRTINNVNAEDPIIRAKFDKCGANLTGENKRYYEQFWKCKFPVYDNNIDWVKYTTTHSPNCQSRNQSMPIYYGPHADLLPKDEDLESYLLPENVETARLPTNNDFNADLYQHMKKLYETK